ncbi:MAG: hypothetical protein EOP02_29920 [Proteobacteria bacterium]|nr:MAG: hypothetical protein EOP02_29920 [Pseudomonadota bacterium]
MPSGTRRLLAGALRLLNAPPAHNGRAMAGARLLAGLVSAAHELMEAGQEPQALTLDILSEVPQLSAQIPIGVKTLGLMKF